MTLHVVSIPTNRPMVRRGQRRTSSTSPEDAKYKRGRRRHRASVTRRASRCWSARSPWEKSEKLARPASRRRASRHEVLNAKQHDREAEIIAPGRPIVRRSRSPRTWPVRGVDILLGGYPEGLAARRECIREGLVVGTPEYEARYRPSCSPAFKEDCKVEGDKVPGQTAVSTCSAPNATSHAAIDNQLRGRAGRPGRPGGEPLSTCRSRTS